MYALQVTGKKSCREACVRHSISGLIALSWVTDYQYSPKIDHQCTLMVHAFAKMHDFGAKDIAEGSATQQKISGLA